MNFYMKDIDRAPNFYEDPYGTWCKRCGNGANTTSGGLHCCACDKHDVCWSCGKAFRVTLPYWGHNDGRFDYVTILYARDEKHAIEKASVSMAEEVCAYANTSSYINTWERANKGEQFGWDDLVPMVEAVKAKF